jgi:glycosyltransferase involved in cell wall biosynthesis
MNFTEIVNLSSQSDKQSSLENIRVLVLFGGSELFGHERATIEIFRNLSQLGLKVRFVISSRLGHENIVPYLEQLGLEWIQVPFGTHWYYLHCMPTNLWGMLVTNIVLWRETQNWQPTHIYTGNWLNLTYASPYIFLSSLPFVYRAGDDIPSSKKIHRLFNRLIFSCVNSLVCNCQFLANQISQKLPFLDPVVIYNHPSDRSEESNKPIELPKLPDGATLILFTGQISEHKGVPLLIESMINIIRSGQNVVLWLAGNAKWNPEFMKQLHSQVAILGLQDRICFLGFVNNTRLLFDLADIHVCPSIWNEPSPNVVFEAKEAGVASVVFSVGGIPELITHKVDGYICGNKTSEALVEALEWMLSDHNRLLAMGEAARNDYEARFGRERFLQQWADIFLQTLKN